MPDHLTIAPHGGTLVDLLVPAERREAARTEAEHLPKLVVNARELSDLEMLTVGALSPLTGFVGEADYGSILETMHLSNGLAWSIPVTLSLTDEDVKRIGAGTSVALLPAEGAQPLAIVEVTEVFKRDREREALGVFGTAGSRASGRPSAPRGGRLLPGGIDPRAGAPRARRLRRRTASRPRRRERRSPSEAGERSSASRPATRSTGPTSTSRSARSRSSTGCSCTRWSARRRATTCRPTCGCAATKRCSRATTRRTARWCPSSPPRCATPAPRRRSGTRSAARTTAARTSSSGATTPASAPTTAPTTRRGSSSAFEPGELGITPLMFEHSFWCNAVRGHGLAEDLPARGGHARVALGHEGARDAPRRRDAPRSSSAAPRSPRS